MGDDCAKCDQDWSGQGPNGGPGFCHIDRWVGGGAGDNSSALIAYEDSLTSNGQLPVIVDPPSTEPVPDNGQGGPLVDASAFRWSIPALVAVAGDHLPNARPNTRGVAHR